MRDSLDFDFEIPIDFFEKSDAEAGKQRRIGGLITLETRDQVDDTVLQRGLDFSDFTKMGWIKDSHDKKTATNIVGYPDVLKLVEKGTRLSSGKVAPALSHWMEGYLLDTDRANKIWELGKALQKTPRRLGFSVEGRINERTGEGAKTIAKALVRNVAITPCPAHPDARMEILAKSLLAVEQQSLERALGMGEVTNPGVKPVGPATGMGAGRILTPQSLETDTRDQTKRKKKKKDEEIKKALSDSEAFAWLRLRLPRASFTQIGRLLDLTKQGVFR